MRVYGYSHVERNKSDLKMKLIDRKQGVGGAYITMREQKIF